MNEMTQENIEKKEQLIKEIVDYTDLFTSESELQKMSYAKIKSLYNSCLIPFLKKKRQY
jgi:hypothetical protein